MKHRTFLAISLAGTAAFAALLLGPQRPPQADVSELFDPAVLARNMCGIGSLGTMFIPPAAAADTAPSSRLWPGLGAHGFKIATLSPQAQTFFDQGLRLIYGFNFGEALASFRAAQEADPDCAMCYWGEAFALGPTLNASTMPEANIGPALTAVNKADALVHDPARPANPRERALIVALRERYSADPKKSREALNAAYADAMYRVYQLFDGDVDIATLHADAALNDRGTGWWSSDGRLPSPRTASALVALERALKIDPDHAGAIHYYIHGMDSSTRPERAEPYANKLAALMPGAGHIVHMPAHIFYRRGRYLDALKANIEALNVDDGYLAEGNSADDVYRYGLYAHNIHFAFASAGMAGDGKSAIALADRLDAFLARGVVARPNFYAGAALSQRVRFASADELLALPEPEALYVKGIRLYARASAQVLKGDVAAARTELNALNTLRTKTELEKLIESHPRSPQMLLLAEEVVRGRIAVAEKKWDEGFKHFAAAATMQEQARGFDPPSWDFPVKQALGLALLKAGRTDEAIKVLREALMDAQNNGVVLYALSEASKAAKDAAAASQYSILFKKAWVGSEPPDLGRI